MKIQKKKYQKKEIEKLNIIKNEHELICTRKQKELTKKIEIMKREIDYENKKKDIFEKVINQKNLNFNNKNLSNKTEINIADNTNKNNEGIYNSEKKVKKNTNRNLFNKNNNERKNIFNYYLQQFNENKNKKRKGGEIIKPLLKHIQQKTLNISYKKILMLNQNLILI